MVPAPIVAESPFTGGGRAAANHGPGTTSALRLREWLQGLTLELPEITVLPRTLGFAVEIAGGSCSGLRIAEIIVKRAVGQASGLEASLELSGVDINCTVAANFSVLGVPERCSVSFSTERAWIALDVSVAASVIGLPAAHPAPTAACRMQPELKDLRIDGRSGACDTLWLLEGTIRRVVNTFTGMLCSFVRSIAEAGLVRVAAVAADASRYATPAAPISPPSWMPASTLGMDELWRNPAVVAARSFLREVGHVDDLPVFNSVVKHGLTYLGFMSPDGSLRLPDGVRNPLPLSLPDLPVPYSQGSAVLSLELQRGAAKGVDTFSSLGMEPESRHAVRMLGACLPRGAVEVAVRLRLPSGQAHINASGHTCRVIEKAPLEGLNVTASGHGRIGGNLSLLIAPDRQGLAALQLDQIQQPGCVDRVLASHVQGGPAQVLSMLLAATPLEARVELAPGQPAAELEAQVLSAIGTVGGAAWDAFGNGFLPIASGWLSGPGRDSINEVLQDYLESPAEPRVCPATSFIPGEYPEVKVPATVLTVLSFALGLSFMLVAALRRLRRHSPAARRSEGSDVGVADGGDGSVPFATAGTAAEVSAPRIDDYGVSPTAGVAWLPARHVGYFEEMEGASSPSLAVGGSVLSDCGAARGLAWSPDIPAAVRWGMVCSIVGTICLFVAATFSVGVSLQLRFEGAGVAYSLPDIAQMSLDNTVQDMLATKAYFLAAAVVLFSLVWPYLKLLMMLYAWLARMTGKRRRHMLVLLDQIGKWSLTDNFAMFLLIVLFRISWHGVDSTDGGDPSNPASIALKCVPEPQLYLFLMATTLSLILGHTMLGVHRWQSGELAVVAATSAAASASGAVPEPLCRRPTKPGARPSIVSSAVTALVLLGAVMLLFWCWTVEIVEIRLHGIAGAFLDITGQPPASKYTLLSIASEIRTQGSLGLQAIMVVFVFALPTMYLTALLVLWVVPLGQQSQFNLFMVSQTLKAWSSLDVFLAGFLGAVVGGQSYGISHFVELIVYHQNVGPLCRAARKIGAECMTLELGMLEPVALVIVAALVSNLAGSYMYRRVSESLFASATCLIDPGADFSPACDARL